MKVTALTDGQLRELHAGLSMLTTCSAEALDCFVALGLDDESTAPEREAARARCVDVWNNRRPTCAYIVDNYTNETCGNYLPCRRHR